MNKTTCYIMITHMIIPIDIITLPGHSVPIKLAKEYDYW